VLLVNIGFAGTFHLQGFVVLQKMCRLSSLKKLNDRVHWEVARGTSAQAAEYCKKAGKFVEFGFCPVDRRFSEESNGCMWELAYAMAKEGRFEEIPKNLFIRYRNTFLCIFDEASKATECIEVLDHLWIVGPTGVGKSRFCWEKFPDHYRKPANKWWCHYNKQECVVVEDVDKTHEKWIGYFLKIWSDHYPYIAERKGGSKQIRPKKIVVTSNYTIADIFSDPGIRYPLERRFPMKMIENGELVDYREPGNVRMERIGVEHYREI